MSTIRRPEDEAEHLPPDDEAEENGAEHEEAPPFVGPPAPDDKPEGEK